ncbi:hypothetical protein HanPI659440_Chr08g0282911 [Helianthus annuus]|nr:hypothetical protein HanPI659440_Chr08g0282911 [Helianthus annuus]
MFSTHLYKEIVIEKEEPENQERWRWLLAAAATMGTTAVAMFSTAARVQFRRWYQAKIFTDSDHGVCDFL